MSKTVQDFRAELTKAVNGEINADWGIQEYWLCFKLQFRVLSAVIREGGVTLLVEEENHATGIDRWDMSWKELEADLAQHQAMGTEDAA